MHLALPHPSLYQHPGTPIVWIVYLSLAMAPLSSRTIHPPREESACSVPDYACVITKYKLVSNNTVLHLHTAALSKSST